MSDEEDDPFARQTIILKEVVKIMKVNVKVNHP